jgi:hypothetical protein
LVSFHTFSVADLSTLFKRNAVKEAYGRTPTLLVALAIPVFRNLLDVMNQAIQVPLRVYFALASEREPVHALVVPYVCKDWLHRPYALAVKHSTS